MRSLWFVLSAALLAVACSAATGPNGKDNTTAGIKVVAGTWAYTLNENIPLPNPPGPKGCSVGGSGTTQVSAGGSYAINFPPLSCSGCTMSASTSGTIADTAVSGTVTATIAGSGCSSEQPTPNPSPLRGTCTATGCNVSIPDGESYGLAYTLSPP